VSSSSSGASTAFRRVPTPSTDKADFVHPQRVSGGLFNPAVSLGMLIVGAISPFRAIILVVSQILGGISGAALIESLLPGTLNVRTLRGGGISVARAFWLETFCTGVLMLSM
jgi:aquaporin related protein